MSDELKDSSSTTAVADPPSYQPPANEPQGLDPAADAKAAEGTKEAVAAETKEPTVKLPTSIKPPTKTGRFQERISDLVSQRDLSKREAEQLREELSRMRGAPKAEAESTKKAATGELSPEDFPTYGEYIKAYTESVIEQKEKALQSKQAQERYESHRAERQASFNEHAAPLAQQFGDGFWDAITDPSLPITEVMADAVMELDQLAPYTMLYLAAHRDEAKKIAGMNPRAATLAIGRLAAQLDYEIKGGGTGTADTSSPDPTIAAPSAVARPRPVPIPRGSSPSLLDTEHHEKDSMQDFARKEAARLRMVNPNARFYVPPGA